MKISNPRLADRLYMNDGKGHFTESVKPYPAILTNKSCVSVADVDHDGDRIFLLVVLRMLPNYGLPAIFLFFIK